MLSKAHFRVYTTTSLVSSNQTSLWCGGGRKSNRSLCSVGGRNHDRVNDMDNAIACVDIRRFDSGIVDFLHPLSRCAETRGFNWGAVKTCEGGRRRASNESHSFSSNNVVSQNSFKVRSSRFRGQKVHGLGVKRPEGYNFQFEKQMVGC